MEVKILGKMYAIKSDHDDGFAQEAALLVDQRIRDMMSKAGPVPPERLAILAALNFAGEYLQIKKKSKDRDTMLKQKLKNVAKLIESTDKKNS